MLITSIVLLSITALCATYYAVLLFAGRGAKRRAPLRQLTATNRFLLVIAAHDEAAVIATTIRRLRELRYPPERFAIHLVADHCSDATAGLARQAGAVVHERREGQTGSKAAALSWLFARVQAEAFDALILFDADADVDADFLRAMNEALEAGNDVVQGLQLISNADAGWYAALTSAMYRIESLLHNEGRTRLGGSARHMGDSICFRWHVIERLGFGSGITEDHTLRQELLLEGTRIAYEPRAFAHNEAARTWQDAKAQRRRWMQGTLKSNRRNRLRMFRTAFATRNFALFEAALESLLPAYSTLAAGTFGLALLHGLGSFFWPGVIPPSLLVGWLCLAVIIGAFPFLALRFSGAPWRAHAALVAGPVFIAWRVWTSLSLRFVSRDVRWVRTPHGATAEVP